MSFKKLIDPLRVSLAAKGFDEPLAFQKEILSKIKAGASMFAVAPKDSGKTTSIVLSVIQKLKGKALNEAPRALIIVKDNQAIEELELAFLSFKEGTDLRVYAAFDRRDLIAQRDDIFFGIDILITTSDRLKKLFYGNGINLNVLQMFIVDDADFMLGKKSLSEVLIMQESMVVCQYLIFSQKYDKRFESWLNQFRCNFQIMQF